MYLTNVFELEALEIAYIYRSRWQIEEFLKWGKQNIQIKTLRGHLQNAVKTQLLIGTGTCMIETHLKRHTKYPYSACEMTQVLGKSTFTKTPVKELFTKKIN